MLNHNGKFWLIGARRIDILFERLVHFNTSRQHYAGSWLFYGALAPAVFMALGTLKFFVAPAEHRNTLGFQVMLVIFSVMILVGTTISILLKRQERPWDYRNFERSYELRLVLPPEIHGDHKLLWRHRREISKYLSSSPIEDTVELGAMLDMRHKQLKRRAKARVGARVILRHMGLPSDRIKGYLAQQATDLQLRELRAIDIRAEAYSDVEVLQHIARLRHVEPEEITDELELTRAAILDWPEELEELVDCE